MEPTMNGGQPQPPLQEQPQSPQSTQQLNGSDIHEFVVMQPGERLLCTIKRHPFGLFSMYISTAFIIIVVLGLALVAPNLVSDLSDQAKMMILLGAIVVAGVAVLYTYIGTIIYNANRWIVTSDSITQVTRVSLFSKETSQLSLANLEDVTVDQNGLLQSMFGFGTLRAESAGARGKFYFAFCPNPNAYARKVIEAHEAYIANKPEEAVAANRPLTSTQSFNQPPPVA
jgi:Bacterial PH domain